MNNTGGPAFSVSELLGNTGMTLLDYFAGQALAGWLASWPADGPSLEKATKRVAKVMYDMADAMVEERGRGLLKSVPAPGFSGDGSASSHKTHILKTDPEPFDAVVKGEKTYEIRFDDRGFQVGDGLMLAETLYTGDAMRIGAPLMYTGRKHSVKITHILRGPAHGLRDGWVILSITA